LTAALRRGSIALHGLPTRRAAPLAVTVHHRALLMLLTVVITWGLTWPVNKALVATVPPLWTVVLRSAIATVALVAVAVGRRRLSWPPREDVPVLLGIALLHMVGFTALSTWGLGVVPAGRTAVLAYTTPLWVAPGAAIFLGERLTLRRALGVVIGLLGLVVLFNPLAFDWTDRAVVLGNLAVVAAAFLWACSILQIRGHRWRSTPFDLAPWETLVATAVLLPLALAGPPIRDVSWSMPLVLMLLFVAIPGTALAYWASAMASRDLPAVTTVLGLLATPVVSILASTAWLGEALTPSLAVASLLVLGGTAIGATGAAAAASPRRR
jgi:drug/metabolite transporter (DMT)-like permease